MPCAKIGIGESMMNKICGEKVKGYKIRTILPSLWNLETLRDIHAKKSQTEMQEVTW